MKKTLLYTCLILLLILIPTSTDAAYQKFTITIPQGTGVPECQETNECFIPYVVTIDVGTTVTWSNDDIAAHTVTSGNKDDGPDGVFGSSLFMAVATFEHTFDVAGEYPYFCMVHPWMEGVVIVGAAAEGIMEGELMISIEAEPAAAGKTTDITVTFITMDDTGEDIHVNYDIMATQGDEIVLDEKGVHDHDGVMTHTTMALPFDASSEMPVDVTVTFNGFGLPDTDPSTWTGPVGEVGTMQVVPEFGTIAMMILGVSIVSIIALSTKSRVIPKL